MIKRLYIFVLILFIGVSSINKTHAQQDAQFSHFMFNPTSVNPAYAGYRDALSIFLLHRSQWMNIEGMPTTQFFSVHSPLKYNKVGLGVNLLYDKIGPTTEIYTNADFSYTLSLKGNNKLSFGLKGGFHILNVDINKLKPKDDSDPTLLEAIDHKFLPQIGAGMLFRTNKLYLGMSVPNFIQSKHYDSSSNYIAKELINYYFTGGYLISLNENLKMQPAFQFKMIEGAPVQFDISTNFMFKDKLSLGVSYRMSAAVSGLISYRLKKDLIIGLAYDYETTKLAQITPGSYEFILRYEIANLRKINKFLNPRFF